jgi:hypothetical protein
VAANYWCFYPTIGNATSLPLFTRASATIAATFTARRSQACPWTNWAPIICRRPYTRASGALVVPAGSIDAAMLRPFQAALSGGAARDRDAREHPAREPQLAPDHDAVFMGSRSPRKGFRPGSGGLDQARKPS